MTATALQLDPAVPSFFAPIFAYLLVVERGPTDGRVDDPDDRGGRTKDGITQDTYDAYRLAHGRPKGDVWDIEDAETSEIYFLDYWVKGRCDLIADRTDKPDRVVAPRLAIVHLDACVQHGIRGTSKKTGRPIGANVLFQEVIGAQPRDGWLGKDSLAVLDARLGLGPLTHPSVWRTAEEVLIATYLDRRQRLYEALARQPGQAKYLPGWLNRLRTLKSTALRYS